MDTFLAPASRPSSATSNNDETEEERAVTPGPRDSEDVNIPKPVPHVYQFIKAYYGLSKNEKSFKCRAKYCNKDIKYSSTSFNNLKIHYEKMHPDQHAEFVAALSNGYLYRKRGRNSSGESDTSDGGPVKKQTSIKAIFKEKAQFDQTKARKLWTKFFIQDIVPNHLTDSVALREFCDFMNSNFRVPSRRTLTRDITRLGQETKVRLESLLDSISFVATTADSWSAHNRSFLGMTIHWIDSVTLKREKAVLGIKEICVRQTADYLAKALLDLHQEFGLTGKVVSTTTDNGANYVAAFKTMYASAAEDNEEVGRSKKLLNNFFCCFLLLNGLSPD